MFGLYASTSESEGEDERFNEEFLIQGAKIMAESCTAVSHRVQRGLLYPVGPPSAISSELIPNSYCVYSQVQNETQSGLKPLQMFIFLQLCKHFAMGPKAYHSQPRSRELAIWKYSILLD